MDQKDSLVGWENCLPEKLDPTFHHFAVAVVEHCDYCWSVIQPAEADVSHLIFEPD